jgi:FO synthase
LDFINPEKAWPEVRKLRDVTRAAGFELRERLAIYPEFVRAGLRAVSEPLAQRIRALTDESGLVRREEEQW